MNGTFEVEHGKGYHITMRNGEGCTLPATVVLLALAMDWFAQDGHNRALIASLAPYIDGDVADVESVELLSGWFGRWTLPGYVDCSEWEFDESETALMQSLRDAYADDYDVDEDEDFQDERLPIGHIGRYADTEQGALLF